jgi:hypothetical protein
MTNGLFYCDAAKVSFGSNDTCRFNWEPSIFFEASPQIISTRIGENEFGDRYTDIGLRYSPRLGVPIVAVRYQHRAGNTGFEYFTKNEYGNPPDREAEAMLDWLLRDAWTWDAETGLFVSYEQRRPDLSYPLDFFINVERGKNALAIHTPSHPPAVEESLNNAEGVQKLSAMLSLAKECRMISVWQPAYGENPVLVAENMKSALNEIAEHCRQNGLIVRQVKSELELPEW